MREIKLAEIIVTITCPKNLISNPVKNLITNIMTEIKIRIIQYLRSIGLIEPE